jgi:hypothetical protein
VRAPDATTKSGKQRAIFAGNDAHGNLNRFRQVKLPMVKLWEHQRHRFGAVTTRVRSDASPSVGSILAALKSGRVIVSDGPALDLNIRDSAGTVTGIGESARNDGDLTALIHFVTSSEFGPVKRLTLKIGFQDGERSVELARELPPGAACASGEAAHPVPDGACYLRAELVTESSDGKTHTALTNPAWLTPE